MRRRDLLKYSLYATLATSGLTRFGLRPAAEQMAGAGIAYGRTLIHVMLLGGADLRYLFVPDPASAREYAAAFCNARKSIYQYNGANAAIYPDYGAVWRALYRSVTDLLTGVSFGIHNNEKVRFEANIADIFGAGKGSLR